MIISAHIPQLKADEHDGRELVAMKGDLRLFMSKLLKRYFMSCIFMYFISFYVQMKQLNWTLRKLSSQHIRSHFTEVKHGSCKFNIL